MHLISNIEMIKNHRTELLICGQNDLLADLWPQIDIMMSFVLDNANELDIGNGWKISCLESDKVPIFTRDGQTAALDADLLFGMYLNMYAPGDRFTPYGMHGKSVKLGDYWTNIGLPEKARKNWPLLRNGNGDIVWVIGTQISDRYKISATTKRILTLHLLQMPNEN